jgi:hypothetical protein
MPEQHIAMVKVIVSQGRRLRHEQGSFPIEQFVEHDTVAWITNSALGPPMECCQHFLANRRPSAAVEFTEGVEPDRLHAHQTQHQTDVGVDEGKRHLPNDTTAQDRPTHRTLGRAPHDPTACDPSYAIPDRASAVILRARPRSALVADLEQILAIAD